MILILLGAPGSGKGTQAGRISDMFGIPHISTGDIFRKNIKDGTELGKKAREYMDKGLLVPDEVTNGIVEDRLADADCGKGFVLDGYPRTTAQAKMLDSVLDKMNVRLDAALNIKVPDKDVIHRLSGRSMCSCGETYHVAYKAPAVEGICDKCGKDLYVREDDKPETVGRRLKEYHEKTSPIINYYDRVGALIDIDGTPMPDIVSESIMEVLKKFEAS